MFRVYYSFSLYVIEQDSRFFSRFWQGSVPRHKSIHFHAQTCTKPYPDNHIFWYLQIPFRIPAKPCGTGFLFFLHRNPVFPILNSSSITRYSIKTIIPNNLLFFIRRLLQVIPDGTSIILYCRRYAISILFTARNPPLLTRLSQGHSSHQFPLHISLCHSRWSPFRFPHWGTEAGSSFRYKMDQGRKHIHFPDTITLSSEQHMFSPTIRYLEPQRLEETSA